MTSLLIKNAALLVSMDDADTRWEDGSLYIEDHIIQQVGPSTHLPHTANRVIDARNMIILPGLVNTHHHFTQTLTRNLPAAQNAGLDGWSDTLHPVWERLTPEAVQVSTQVAIAELMLSGCTTTSDHTYLWPNGTRVDDQIEAATEMGNRFHVTRGFDTPEATHGEEAVLRDCHRVIERYHDAVRYAMLRVVLAPCSPSSVSFDLMRESAALARSYGVHLHTHLTLTRAERDYYAGHFGRSPVEVVEEVGWLGADVWFAHVVDPTPEEMMRLGTSQTGAAHCPSSNMRISYGIAPVRLLQQAGVRVGLGVDGASGDGGHLLAEARQAMLLQRVVRGPSAFSAVDALRLATRGGAEVLGRDDIGILAPGMAADCVGYRLDTLSLAGGAVHDPLAALIFCQTPSVDLSVINGIVRIMEGQFVEKDLSSLIKRHNAIASALVRGELRPLPRSGS